MQGKCWNSDVNTAKNQILNFPEMDPAKVDVDKFSALKRLVGELIKFDSLAKSVSVHNFTARCSTDKLNTAHCNSQPLRVVIRLCLIFL